MMRVCASVVLMLMLITGCAHNRVENADSDAVYELSDRDLQEIEAGKTIHNEIISRFVVYEHPKVNAYVREIGESFLPYVERPNLPYAFTVLFDDRVYATAAPGGHIYVTTGFILVCSNEAELAAVIAHEVSQAQYRLPDPRIKDTLSRLRPVLAMALSMFLGPYGSLAVMGVDLAGYWATLEKSRAARTVDADHDGMLMMLEAGYDPQGMLDVFYTILSEAKKDIRKLYNYHQSHPISDERFESLLRSYEECDLTGRTFETNRERFLMQTDPLRR